jgi:hypothetical protein
MIPHIISFDTIDETVDWLTTEDVVSDLIVYIIPLPAECASCDGEIEEYTAAYLLRDAPRVVCQTCFNKSGVVLDRFSQERIIATMEQYT